MGKKFDKKLPSMSDYDLAEVDKTTLNTNSRQNLAIERRKREFKQTAANRNDHERRDWTKWLQRAGLTPIIHALPKLLASLAARIFGLKRLSRLNYPPEYTYTQYIREHNQHSKRD